MFVNQMRDLLGYKLSDPSELIFKVNFKLKTLGLAQTILAQLLANRHLDSLKTLETNITVTDGIADLNDLSNKVLRGAEGILKIRVRDGVDNLYAEIIDILDVKKTENLLVAGSVMKPYAYVFENKIYMLPSSITAIDIYYLKMPSPLLFPFVYTRLAAGASPTSFVGNSGQNLVDEDDRYNNGLIYDIASGYYYLITDYDDAVEERTFTVVPDHSIDFETDGTFYFLSHDFDKTNLEAAECVLNPAFHSLVMGLAEGICWMMDDKIANMNSVFKKTFNDIKELNLQETIPATLGV